MYTRSHWSWIHPWTERIRTKFMKRFYVPELFRCCVLSKVKKSSDSDSSLPGLYYKWSILEWPSGWAGQGRDKIKISQEIWFKNQKYPVKLLTLQRSEFKCCGLERGFCWWCFHDHGQEIWELRKLPKLSLMDLKEIIYVASDWIIQNLDIGGNCCWLVLTLTRGIDARLCQDFLCHWELAINSRPSFSPSVKTPSSSC